MQSWTLQILAGVVDTQVKSYLHCQLFWKLWGKNSEMELDLVLLGWCDYSLQEISLHSWPICKFIGHKLKKAWNFFKKLQRQMLTFEMRSLIAGYFGRVNCKFIGHKPKKVKVWRLGLGNSKLTYIWQICQMTF